MPGYTLAREFDISRSVIDVRKGTKETKSASLFSENISNVKSVVAETPLEISKAVNLSCIQCIKHVQNGDA